MQSLLERAFVEPFRQLAEQLAGVVPALIVVVVILVVGGALAWLARLLVKRLLDAIHFDRIVEQSGMAGTIERTRMFQSPSDFGARLVQGAIWVFIILFALNAVDTEMTDRLVMRFFNYLPDVLAAALVLLLGSLISKFLSRSALLAAVNAQWPAARLIAGTVRVMVMLLAVVIALEQLRIGSTTLLLTFSILFAGIVIAAAIAFGLGARDMAREWLQKKVRPPEPEEEETFKHL
jgi:hypothetical protein